MNAILEELFERSVREVDTVIGLDSERVYIRFGDESSLIVPRYEYEMFLDAGMYENFGMAMHLLHALRKKHGERSGT